MVEGVPWHAPSRSNLDGLFSARVRAGVGAALADAEGSVVFDAPPVGRWTLTLTDGRVRLTRGGVRRPAAVVAADPAALTAVLEGTTCGVQAFLDGGICVRGNLALALQIDGAFDVGERPVEFPRAGFADVAGVRTAYLEAGPRDAPPIVLLHGLGATNASMLPLLTDLARDHRVLAPDTPGFGASAAPRWRYSAAELGTWVLAFQRTLGADPAVLIGNSLGGRMAIETGLLAPDSVRALVLLCASPAFRRMRQLVPAVRLVSPELGRLPFWLHHRLVVESIRSMFAEPGRLPRAWYDAAADEFRRVMSRPAYRRSFVACLRQIYLDEAYGDSGFWERLPGLAPPALFVWGARDRLVPARFAHYISEALPQSVSTVLPDCGHVPQFEHPLATLELVRDYLGELG